MTAKSSEEFKKFQGGGEIFVVVPLKYIYIRVKDTRIKSASKLRLIEKSRFLTKTTVLGLKPMFRNSPLDI